MANITVNRAYFIGRLAKDPVTKTIKINNADKKVTNFHIICGDDFKTNETDIIPIQAWGSVAEIAEKYLHKGNLVYVEGSIKTKNKQSPDGKWNNYWKVNINKIKMLPSGQKVDRNEETVNDFQSIYDGIHSNYDDTEVADTDGIISMADLPY